MEIKVRQLYFVTFCLLLTVTKPCHADEQSSVHVMLTKLENTQTVEILTYSRTQL